MAPVAPVASAAVVVSAPHVPVTESSAAVMMTPTTITSAAAPAKVEDKSHATNKIQTPPVAKTIVKEQQPEEKKEAVTSPPVAARKEPEPVKKEEAKNKIVIAPAAEKTKPEVKSDKIPIAAKTVKTPACEPSPAAPTPVPPKVQSPPKAEEKRPEPPKQVPEVQKEKTAPPAPVKPAEESPKKAKQEEKPAAKQPEQQQEEEEMTILDDPNSRCITDLVDEAEACDAAIVAETGDPDAKFSPGDMACLVSYEELGVDYVLEKMQEAWKAVSRVQKPVSSVRPGEFVIFSKVVPEEGTVFVRGFVLAVNPKGDRINAMDIDSGFCKKVDLANVYKMRPEDKEYPGLGSRVKAAKPLDAKQQESVQQTLQESFSPPVKLARLQDGTIQ